MKKAEKETSGGVGKIVKTIKIWWVAGLVGMFMGFGMGATSGETKTVEVEVPSETKTVTKEVQVIKTPESCKKALDYDNEIFTSIGTNIDTFNFDAITATLNRVKDDRTVQYALCHNDM